MELINAIGRRKSAVARVYLSEEEPETVAEAEMEALAA